ncbi:penicillin acylase family protein [Flammeovirga sp. EKP202]|uniref:penicillin acylase family protein n=1 Tax=Flammeovirga sp. EKP202 TaxID=2770592 RepID=UPI00165F25C8|nr:penicillin acylase family protein [Flammeovirga sp. EKP202]MBD0401204.1 penicillin acylase family protein [Flammeovirga sp. EKP202]
MRSSIAGIISAFTFFCIVALDSKINNIPPLGRFLDPFQGFWQNEVKNEKLPESIQLPKMISEGVIYYDSLLIPHIYSENEHDLYYLQGYVTARHRLWQMDFQAMAAAGRLSEVFGNLTVKYDKGMRRQGLQYGAEQFIKSIKNDKKMMSVLNAYTNGVNAYIDQLSYADYPVEYKFFNYKPEYWTPLKTALIFKFIQYSLSGPDYDFENTNSLRHLGKKNFDLLFPEILPFQEPIANNDSIWDNLEVIEVKAPQNMKLLSGLRKHAVEKDDPDNGSNNWVVSGSKTKSGNPILCNDPHLSLTMPSIWFSNQLTHPKGNVMGMSIPGIPCIVVGFNEDIAWGVTSARRDDRDWYKILFQDKSRTHYLIDNYWSKADLRIEEIKIRDKEALLDTVRYTRWGPIVYDQNFGSSDQKEGYALRWTAHDGSRELRSLYLINHAKDYKEFDKGLSYFSGPALNFAFASKDSTIAMNIQGRFPNRWKNQGKFVLDGTRLDTKWQGFIPNEHNIRVINPKSGYVSSANEHPANNNYPYYHYGQYFEYYRNRRIHQLLDSAKDLTIDELSGMMNDNYSLFAEENLTFMLEHLKTIDLSDGQKSIYTELRTWDYYYSPQNSASIYFEEWAKSVSDIIWDEFHNHPSKEYAIPTRVNTFYLLQHKPDLIFIDELETAKKENIEDIMTEAFLAAVKKVDQWNTKNPTLDLTWANYKNTMVQHLGRLPGFNIENVQNGGYRGIVNATKEKHGPSFRMLVEMTPQGPEAYQVMPGGQSGNAGSPYYDNMISKFEKGELYKVIFFAKDDYLKEPPQELLKSERIKN